jgi:hypothetical protein
MRRQRQQSFGAAGGFEWLLLSQLAGQRRNIFDDTARCGRVFADLGQDSSHSRINMASRSTKIYARDKPEYHVLFGDPDAFTGAP